MAYPFDIPAASTSSKAGATPTAPPSATPINWNALKLSEAPMKPAVITSRKALDDINNIQTQHATINNDITNQAARVAQENEAKRQAEVFRLQQEVQNKQNQLKLEIDKKNAESKAAAVSGQQMYLSADGKSYSTTPPPAEGEEGYVDPNQAALDQSLSEYQRIAEETRNTLTNIQNGVIPLSASEQAQIEGLKQQFQVLIDQQILENKNASGVANIRGYQKGAAEYDPTFQANTIGSIVTAGMNKVADLNIKMASAVAALTQGFKDNNIENVKDSWNIYQDAAEKRQEALQKTIDNAQKKIKEAQEAKAAEKEAQLKQLDYETKYADAIASSVFNALTGDAAKDEETLQNFSKQYGIDPNVLMSSVEAYSYSPDKYKFLSAEQDFKNKQLDAQYTRAQISKIYADIEKDKITDMGDPSQIIAYANEYAANGKIPSGLPKGTFGIVAQVAKELPKSPGQIVSRTTGVSPAENAALQQSLGALYSAVDLAKQLKELDKQRWGGIVSGLAGKIVGNADQQRYIDLRTQIVDLLARARTGAALTTSEEKHYAGMLPGRFDEPFGIGADSEVRIDNFVNTLSRDLENKASAQGWAVNGVTKIKIGGQEFRTGDIIKNASGQQGRVNPDGSITIIQ